MASAALLLWLALQRLLGASAQGSELERCLRQAVREVAFPGEQRYEEARKCKNLRRDIEPRPLAVARVNATSEVQAAVRCASAAGVEACARAGGHGFENAAGCSGGVLVDVQDLHSLEVDVATKTVRFGSGCTLGQLYYRLKVHHGLVVPGGAESSVGAAGLFLGCGRGLLTHLHGLACDTILGLEYVDARGELRTADARTNADMLWMARGGGGEFPGIITRFRVQAFDAPQSLYSYDCSLYPEHGKAWLRAWLARLPDMLGPGRGIFTNAKLWGGLDLRFSSMCVDCDQQQRTWLDQTIAAIAREGGGHYHCHNYTQDWFSRLLYEAGVHTGAIENDPRALMDRHQGFGSRGEFLASKNGGRVLQQYSMPDDLLDATLNWTYSRFPAGHAYQLVVVLYPLGGAKVEEVPASAGAYGHRAGKLVYHTKHQWHAGSREEMELLTRHHRGMATDLEPRLPCQEFYNYMAGELPCAPSNDAWLAAHFSDVPRMKAIKAAADPTGVFRSRLPLPARRRLGHAASRGRGPHGPGATPGLGLLRWLLGLRP